jgi:ABC-type dipeptide/oligopeptide/nickel transport system permease component
MGRYILRRLLIAIPTIIGIVSLVFVVLRLAPGDPVNLMIPPDLPAAVREERVDEIRARYGFDQPLYVQYVRYLWGVARLDFGNSIRQQSPIIDDLKRRIPNTLHLGLLSDPTPASTTRFPLW